MVKITCDFASLQDGRVAGLVLRTGEQVSLMQSELGFVIWSSRASKAQTVIGYLILFYIPDTTQCSMTGSHQRTWNPESFSPKAYDKIFLEFFRCAGIS